MFDNPFFKYIKCGKEISEALVKSAAFDYIFRRCLILALNDGYFFRTLYSKWLYKYKT